MAAGTVARALLSIHVIDASTVERLLDMSTCIDLVARAQAAISRGEVDLPQRGVYPVAGGNNFYVMPGEIHDPPVFGAKLVSRYADNPAHGLPSIQGQIVLFDSRDGIPIAVVDAASVTAIRTAAASGAATRALAREDASTVALLGYGVQARTHLEAMCAVRGVRQARVWGPSLEKAESFVLRNTRDGGPTLVAVSTSDEAVAGADIICGVSNAREPIVRSEHVRDGAHVNLVGAHGPRGREADDGTMARARVFTEVTRFAMAESGDLLLAIAAGAVTAEDVVGEIGAVIEGTVEGRRSDEDVTVYLSHGNTAQDLVAAHHIVDRAR